MLDAILVVGAVFGEAPHHLGEKCRMKVNLRGTSIQRKLQNRNYPPGN